MSRPNTPPVLCFVGLSGCGKTTLTARVIESLSMQGYKIGALKHASHGFQMDKRGKDTDRFRQAGAYAIGVASDTERAVITSTPTPTSLAELVQCFATRSFVTDATSPEALAICVNNGRFPAVVT